VVSGVVLGILMATWRMAYRILYPPIVASQGMPKVALAPLILLWFGFGMTSKVVIAALIAFFPIVVATLHGMASVPPELIRLGRSMGLSRIRLFFRIQAPSALPEMFSGFKIGIALALIGAIVAEFVASNRGLGYLLVSSMSQLNTATVIATLLVLGLVGIVLYTAVDVLERFVIPWHVASGARRESLAV
jgi:NitT/TauT family transport system permease protein